MPVTEGQEASLKQHLNVDLKDEKVLAMKNVKANSSKQRKEHVQRS